MIHNAFFAVGPFIRLRPLVPVKLGVALTARTFAPGLVRVALDEP
jgi:hypothetical protein